MKVFLLAAGFMFALGMGALNEDATPVAPEDRYYVKDNKPVDLKFQISQVSAEMVELSLNQGQGSQNLFFQFQLGSGWESGKSSLVMKGLSDKSKVKGNERAKIARFEKDSKGKPVNFYTLRHTIVEDNKGQKFMEMSYIGAAMPLLDELVVEKDHEIPVSLTKRFGVDGLVFKAGTYKIDKTINGFRIAIKG